MSRYHAAPRIGLCFMVAHMVGLPLFYILAMGGAL